MAKNTNNGAGHTGRAHALLSASSSGRWLNCTAAPMLEDQEPNTSSKYADEGTLAHEVSEVLLRQRFEGMTDKQAEATLAKLKKNPLYSEEMPDYAFQHFNTVLDFVANLKAEAKQLEGDRLYTYIEQRVDLTDYVPDGFGTVDFGAVIGTALLVVDLKYGKGVRVDALNNTQLMLYALGLLREVELTHGVQVVVMAISQPRLDHVSEVWINADELREWGEQVVKPKAVEAASGNGKLAPGKHCRFCKVAHKCRALAEFSAREDFADIDEKSDLLTLDELAEYYARVDTIEAWVNALRQHVLGRALRGDKLPGYKVVEGRSVRAWSDKDAAYDKLLALGFTEEQVAKRTLKGLGDIGKLMPKQTFEEELGPLIVKPTGKPTLVPLDDKRPEMNLATAAEDFADIDVDVDN